MHFYVFPAYLSTLSVFTPPCRRTGYFSRTTDNVAMALVLSGFLEGQVKIVDHSSYSTSGGSENFQPMTLISSYEV